jgi:exopolyphosphatase/guanosine-5'-triphosphate,3'-diphosphate pyrophosphatase
VVRFAAIDIGSNAVRLLLARVFEDASGPYFKKEALFRMPLRLGDDAFIHNRISEEKAAKLVQTMAGFQRLMQAYEPLDHMACATSAMREAENGSAIAARIREETQIALEVIDGKAEAEVIYANHFAELLDTQQAYLYCDVGGGSTELTLFAAGRVIASMSFNIGTVRILAGRVPGERWEQMRRWIRNETRVLPQVSGIGSGGNINKVFRLTRGKEGKPISLRKIVELAAFLRAYSYEDRVKVLGLRPDRADVILPAIEIYQVVMHAARIKRMYVPQIGLADGLIHLLYERYTGAGRAR